MTRAGEGAPCLRKTQPRVQSVTMYIAQLRVPGLTGPGSSLGLCLHEGENAFVLGPQEKRTRRSGQEGAGLPPIMWVLSMFGCSDVDVRGRGCGLFSLASFQ